MKRILVVAVSMLLLASGCGDDDGSTTKPPPADTDPPIVANVLAINSNQIEVTFDEPVDATSAQRPENYVVVEGSVPVAWTETGGRPGTDINLAAPGDTLGTATAALISPGRVLVSLFQNTSSTAYGLFVRDVEDLSGNRIMTPDTTGFTGSTAADNTPPEFLAGSPQGNNVGIGQTIVVQFSEPMDVNSVIKAFSLRVSGNLTAVAVEEQGNLFNFVPVTKLPNGATCTVRIETDAKDWAGNALPSFAEFVFNTTTSPDFVPPTLTSMSPSDGNTNVSVNTVFTLNFSEPIEPTSVDGSGEGATILLYPSLDGAPDISSSGTQLTFTPFEPLAANTFYTIMVPDGAVRDLAGNPLAGTTTAQFTTGSTLPSGSMTGSVTGSGQAANPGGTIVIATTSSLLGDDDDLQTRGTGTVAGNGTYVVNTLPDSWYFPFGINDSNNDGFLDPEKGDAIGVYGVDIAQNDTDPDSVLIQGGGAVGNVDFPLFDPVSISGTVIYGGSMHTDSLAYFDYLVGAFDTTGFDTTGGFPSPDFGIDAERITQDPHYSFGLFGGTGLDPGTYYIGAFLDVNGNMSYEPATDPAGFYQLGGQFLAVTVANGTDWDDVNIVMVDPGAAAVTSMWRAPGDTDTIEERRIRRMVAAIREAVDKLDR